MGIISGLLSMFGWGTADFLGAISSRRIGHILTLFWMQTIGFCIAFFYFLVNFSSFNISPIGASWAMIAVPFSRQSFKISPQLSLLALLLPIGLKERLALNRVFGIIGVITGLILISI